MLIATYIGIIGMLFVLTAFVLDEFIKKFSQDTLQYNLLNIIGSGMLIYYALLLKSWPFFILNLVWMVVGIIKLIELLLKIRHFSY